MIDENKPTSTEKLPVKKTKAAINYIDVVTLGVIPVLLIVVAMLYMTQISLNGSISLEQLGVESVLLYAATITIYMLLRSYSRRRGRATENWQKAFSAVESNNDKIIQNGYSIKTVEYCRNWETEELTNSRAHVLADAGITVDDFNSKYLAYSPKEILKKYTELTKHQYKTICRAKKIKRLKYDENYLSVYNKNGRRKAPSGYLQAKTLEKFNIARVLLTTAITSLFMGSIVPDVISDLSFTTVVMCLAKIVTILIGGIAGMLGGYNITAVKEVKEMHFKADEQRRFIMWCEKQTTENEAKNKTKDTAN